MKKLALFLLLITPINSFAASRYIRADAIGANNGTTWADAWTAFSSVTWTRGNTYYLAGGDYTGDFTMSATESGSSWVILKKANAADNSGDAGWSASYATTQAVITGRPYMNNGYMAIDGVTGDARAGYGIKFHTTTNPANSAQLYIYVSTDSPRYIQHLDIEGPGFDYGALPTNGLYVNSTAAGATGFHGFYVGYNWIHEIPCNGASFYGHMTGTSFTESPAEYGLLFEHNIMERTGGEGMRHPGDHGQATSWYSYDASYVIMRNNIFNNVQGQGMVSWLSMNPDHFRIYNNIMYSDSGASCTRYGIATGGTTTYIDQYGVDYTRAETIIGSTLTNITQSSSCAIGTVAAARLTCSGSMSGGITNNSGDEFSVSPVNCRANYNLSDTVYGYSGFNATYIQIYNNTFYNMHQAQMRFDSSPNTGTEARNNLWIGNFFGSGSLQPPTVTNEGYWDNADGAYDPANTETADPVLDSANYDFHLKGTANAISGGYDLSSIFTTDFEGNARTGSWSIGAYQGAGLAPGTGARGRIRR
jgi:hypothetical protein